MMCSRIGAVRASREKQGTPHGSARGDQRIRPYRPELPAGGDRAGEGDGGEDDRLRRRQRPHDRQDPRASAEVRLRHGPPRQRRHGQRQGHQRRRRRVPRPRPARPGAAAVGRPWRRPRRRVDRVLHRSGQGRRPRGCGRAPRDRQRAEQWRRRHVRVRGQPRDLRPGRARRRVERELHDELLRADDQGARRCLRGRQRPDDHRPRVHGRPDACRWPPQRPSPGPSGRHQHRAVIDRRRPGHEPRAGLDEGQARRSVAARAVARRLDHRLHRCAEQGRNGG